MTVALSSKVRQYLVDLNIPLMALIASFFIAFPFVYNWEADGSAYYIMFTSYAVFAAFFSFVFIFAVNAIKEDDKQMKIMWLIADAFPMFLIVFALLSMIQTQDIGGIIGFMYAFTHFCIAMAIIVSNWQEVTIVVAEAILLAITIASPVIGTHIAFAVHVIALRLWVDANDYTDELK